MPKPLNFNFWLSTVCCIDKLDQYATATAQDIFDTFQKYHSILQNLEQEAYVTLKKRAQATLQELHNVQNWIDVSGSLIARVISNIDQFKNVTPADVDLPIINNQIMTFLETLMVDFDRNQFNNNWFRLDVNTFKTKCDLKDLCKIRFEDSEIYAKMKNFYTARRLPTTSTEASSNYPDISSDSSRDLISTPKKSSKLNGTFQMQRAEPSKYEPMIKSREVTICKITDSMTFHVQDIDFKARADQFMQRCNQSAMEGKPVSTVVVDQMYLVFEIDKDEWYRGVVTERKEKITLYLVDYGRHVAVKVDHIRPISDNLKKIPPHALPFILGNVEPTGGKWSGDSIEIITQMAENTTATIIYADGNAGDCIVYLDYPTSIEDTLLYLDYAKPRNIDNESENQLYRNMIREKKLIMDRLRKLREITPFTKHTIKDETYCKVTNIVSPAQLYITSNDHVTAVEALHKEIQEFYESGNSRKFYYPHVHMNCCVWVDHNWYRARIQAHLAGCVVKVYLVDVGKYENIEWRYIRPLDDNFSKLPEGVVECCLAHISPKDYADEWGPEVTTELKRLCKYKLRVDVIGTRTGMVNIELYIIKKTINYQINAYLANRQLVEWIGEGELIVERRNDNAIDSELGDDLAVFAPAIGGKARKEFRQFVKILDSVSPSEFYVTYTKYDGAIKKMHTEIQNLMKSHVAENDNHPWQTDEHCLVFGKLSNGKNKSWYRGRIESIRLEANTGTSIFCVYLRDHGQTVVAELSDLAPISVSYLNHVVDGALKCNLAGLKPTSTDWANAAITEFNYIVQEEYDTFAISVHGEITRHSTPVYLWGREKAVRDDALGGDIAWININEALATKGFADCTENFANIVDCNQVDTNSPEIIDFNKWLDELTNGTEYQASAKQKRILFDEDHFILDAELDPDHQSFFTGKVTAWLPAKLISLYYFNGIVTYVDSNAIIYLHEQSRSSFVNQIKYIINKSIDHDNYDPSYKWQVNEPCMVKFYLDGCFYRGLVKEIMPNDQYSVLFVDYGNIDTYDACDLRSADIPSNVPIQTSKFYMAYVKSINDKGIWDKKILEFIHYNIVNKTVAIRVVDDIDHEYVPCTLTVGQMDLIKTLVADKLAEYTDTLKVNVNTLEACNSYSQKSERTVRDVDLYKESNMPLDEFKKEIDKKKEATKVIEQLNQFELDLSADFIVEDSGDLLPNSFLRGDSVDYACDFEPHDTSTTISTAMKSFCLRPFKQIKLSDDVTKFSCKIYEVLDTLHLFVEPIIQEYSAKFEIMENKIKRSKAKKISVFDASTSRCCLAPYSEDNCYYRAVINDRISKTKARVRFVDYLNEEVVDCKSLRECPADVVEQPLKHLLVRLHGVRPSRRIRDSDIKRQLGSLIGRTAVAIMVVNDDNPSVRLYDSDNPEVLLYKSLIDSKFYTETRD